MWKNVRCIGKPWCTLPIHIRHIMTIVILVKKSCFKSIGPPWGATTQHKTMFPFKYAIIHVHLDFFPFFEHSRDCWEQTLPSYREAQPRLEWRSCPQVGSHLSHIASRALRAIVDGSVTRKTQVWRRTDTNVSDRQVQIHCFNWRRYQCHVKNKKTMSSSSYIVTLLELRDMY